VRKWIDAYLAENAGGGKPGLVSEGTRCRRGKPSLSMRAGHPRNIKTATVPTVLFLPLLLIGKIHWR